jgi:phosphoribosylanthranilate isomerase
MIKIKVCGMRDLLNIREVVKSGPDYLGFIFYPGSKRYVGKEPDDAIFREVQGEVQKVGVFVNENQHSMLELAARYSLNLVQLHGSESPQYCEIIRSSGIKVIKAFGIDEDFKFESTISYQKVCDFLLFDTKSLQHGGTGLKFNWKKIREYQYKTLFFLSGGIGPEDVQDIRDMKHPALHALDINSRFEVEPGIKNVDLVRTFIKEIKNTD